MAGISPTAAGAQLSPGLALVTGGAGFLGRAIVRQLQHRGWRVRILARGDYSALAADGIECIRADIRNGGACLAACRGCDVVFHVAARIGMAGRYADFHAINVTGTRNIIAACRDAGVPRLVHTSSPSVVFDGRDMEGVNESVPYPSHFSAHYPRTKALAEQDVLSANDARLATVALRPHLIWGPGDGHIVPTILRAGRAGRLRRIAGANKRIDSVYIDNAADAHLAAMDRLAVGSSCAGRAYFVSNDEPMPLWDLVNAILDCGGLPPVTRSIPRWLANLAGWVFETAYGLLPLPGQPPLTRFVAEELSTAHWFDITAAKTDLGYTPRVSIADGLIRLRHWLASHAPYAGGKLA